MSKRPVPFTGGGDDAIVAGTFVFDAERNCVLLDGMPVVWPAGARWQSDPPAVLVSGLTLTPGTAVTGGGGYHQLDWIKAQAGDTLASAAAACIGPTGEVAYFNEGSKVELADQD